MKNFDCLEDQLDVSVMLNEERKQNEVHLKCQPYCSHHEIRDRHGKHDLLDGIRDMTVVF